MKRVAHWIGIALIAMVVIGVGAVYFALHSRRVHDYVRAKAEQHASEQLNARVSLGDFQLRLTPPTLDIYNLTVRSNEPENVAPLLTLKHANIGVRIVSFIHRKWYLSNVELDNPVVHVYVDAAGNNNLPKPRTSNKHSSTNIFDLAIRRAVVANGEVYYNDRKTPLTAELHDVTLEAGYDQTGGGRYSGEISYHGGRLKFANYSPMPHDFEAHFDARRSGMQLSPAVLDVAGSHLRVNASVVNYSNPTVDVEYDAALSVTEARRLLRNASLPEGEVLLKGKLHYQAEPGRPLLESLTADGVLASRRLLERQPSLTTEGTNIAARYRLANNAAEINGLRIGLLGGEVTGSAHVNDLAGARRGAAELKISGIDLARAQALAGNLLPQGVALTGSTYGDLRANWRGNLQDLVADANAAMSAQLQRASGTNVAPPIPVQAALHAHYNGARQEITLTDSSARTPETQLLLNGTVSQRSALQVQLDAFNLHELEAVSNIVLAPKPGQQPLGLYGAAHFYGTVSGSTSAPSVQGQLTANNITVRGTQWRLLRGRVSASPGGASVQNGELDPAQQGRIIFNAQVGLNAWVFTSQSPLSVQAQITQVSVAEVARAANVKTHVSGVLNGNVAIHGSQANPLGHGVLNIANVQVAQEPIQSASLRFNGDGNAVHADLDAQSTAGAAHAVLTYYPEQQGYELELQVPNLRLEQLQTLKAHRVAANGVLTLQASGKGTIKDPQLDASATIPQLIVRKQTIRGLKLTANVAQHVATLDLNSEVADTFARAHGTIGLEGNMPIDASFDTQNIPLQPLVATYAPDQAADFSGQTELHATVRGPLKDRARLEAHVVVPQLDLQYKTVQLAAAQPIRVDYANGMLVLQRSQIRGTGTQLDFQGNIPVASNAQPRLLLQGTVDLKMLELIQPDIESSGQLQFDINSYGATNPDVKGQVRIVNASLLPADLPIGLSKGNGVLTLGPKRLDVQQFEAQVGGGRVVASGGIVYRPSLQFDLALHGNDITYIYNDALRANADAQLAVMGTPAAGMVRGRITLTHLSFTPDFDLATFIGQLSGETASAPSSGMSQNLKLNIALQTASEMNLVSRTLSVQGSANLEVAGTAANPIILGRADLSGGDLIFRGNRYVVQSGSIVFANPVRTEPVVNIAVNTTINEYSIDMRFQGPVDRLQTAYTSDPALPPVDIINLLAFGKTTEATAQSPSTPSTLGAESALASGLSSGVTSRVEKIAGISQLTIDPTLGGNNQNPGARIAVQQRVTGNLFVTYATDLTETQRQQIQVEYRLSRKWSVSGTRDQNGGLGFDARIHKEF
ncbi:MAG TPA: translocation/assembly module TamB domain-containing protein [Candidatus Acidoferrales bacterium]|nr:translocation/assembly module TamB domain-containing protein [Candidatus Acidoferrales bacterium]